MGFSTNVNYFDQFQDHLITSATIMEYIFCKSDDGFNNEFWAVQSPMLNYLQKIIKLRAS